MLETPVAFNASLPRVSRTYPADDLAAFRWHTGATLRPLAPAESCPVLFRDIGPAALALFLRGRLPRLAGPLSPLVYMRTEEYVEPYTDYERIGRLLILRPLLLNPWHAGVPHVFVARARSGVDTASIGFVPGEMTLTAAARLAGGLTDTCQWHEALGVRFYQEAVAESLHTLGRLAAELEQTEKRAAPLRSHLQSGERSLRERTRAEMERVSLTEADLCTAWHHLPRERRGWIAEALRRVDAALLHPHAGVRELPEKKP